MSGITSVCRPVLWLPRSSVASCLRDAGACALRSHAGESVRVFGGMSARRHALGWVELAKPSLRGLASLPVLDFVPQPSLQGSLSQSPERGNERTRDRYKTCHSSFIIHNSPFIIHHSSFTIHHSPLALIPQEGADAVRAAVPRRRECEGIRRHVGPASCRRLG